MRTIYFHGMPGSPEELRLFDGIDTSSWIAPNRGELPPGATQSERFDLLAKLVRAQCRVGPVRLVGFSLGAYVALETASRLPDEALTLDLISAAAPLNLGAFLERMAGRSVFALARDWTLGFSMLACSQAILAAAEPGLFTDALFASAQGEDRALSRELQFRRRMGNVLRESLRHGSANYRSEIRAYVGQWSHILQEIRHPVTLWYGEFDNWAPAEMGRAIASKLPNAVDNHVLRDMSHYSALGVALAKLSDRKVRAVD